MLMRAAVAAVVTRPIVKRIFCSHTDIALSLTSFAGIERKAHRQTGTQHAGHVFRLSMGVHGFLSTNMRAQDGLKKAFVALGWSEFHISLGSYMRVLFSNSRKLYSAGLIIDLKRPTSLDSLY